MQTKRLVITAAQMPNTLDWYENGPLVVRNGLVSGRVTFPFGNEDSSPTSSASSSPFR